MPIRGELSLLGCGVLRFLGLYLRILRRHPHMPFFPSNNQHPSLEPFLILQRPVCFPSQIPSMPFRRRPLYLWFSSASDGRLGFITPKERERRQLRKKSRPYPEGRIQLVDMTGRYSFSDSERSNGEHKINNAGSPNGITHPPENPKVVQMMSLLHEQLFKLEWHYAPTENPKWSN